MKPSDTAMTKTAAAIPKTGCFSPSTSPPLIRNRLVCAGDDTTARQGCFASGTPKANGPRITYTAAHCQRYKEELLLVVSAASGKDPAVGHGDLCLAQSIRIGRFGADT